MSFLEYLGVGLGIVLTMYVVVRVITAAYYQSRRDFERSKHNGTTRTTRTGS